ncbi:hypothetical protein O6H91_14G015100 [Diphasiastrum complanatum]|uniref:Uncharacterized protein n=2 Tax=Diphasiastrum complanatum TaxID=34168 RepID=A0ACC2BMQ2_DIPCM|nr:hypothetical protein O6H91_14G015100 [Diphasiastrum complanatum]KAJ7530689.1 hypothetical protein O6H91_14G015100 [Diphasiastrum complanatum]
MAQKKGSKQEVADDEIHVPLQAILMADSFAQKFRPITLERPKVLLPLVNVPMIDYTLEWLASAGVEEVFVFCCAHAKQVTTYLDRSNWRSQPNFAITIIESHDCLSIGDALRFIDQRNVVRGDFVLVSGDVVSNMPLTEVLRQHKERRKKDKLSVMTMVVKRSKLSPITHQSRLGNNELVLVIDPASKQLLYYDAGFEPANKDSSQRQIVKHVILDKSIVADRSAVQLCTDLQDCHIDICSPEVLMLFTDNFDYQRLRRDFVKGLLSDEVMGNKVYTYEIYRDYAARVDNLRAYDTISKDIIHRWTYPLVPDIQFGGNRGASKLDRCNVYKGPGIVISRTAKIGENTVLGEGTVIGENSVIVNSVIGRGCIIGNNAIVENSYVWNNVTIGDDARMKESVVCDGVVVKSGAVMEPGVVLSFKVVIGSDFTVPAYSKISLVAQPTEEGSSDEELECADTTSDAGESPPGSLPVELSTPNGASSEILMDSVAARQWDSSEVGNQGAGFKWIIKEGSQTEEWRHSVAPFPKELLEDILKRQIHYDNEDAIDSGAISGAESTPSTGLNDDDDVDDLDQDEQENDSSFFEREVEETFRRAVSETSGVQQDHVVLEVNALKLAYNLSFSDCAGAMFRAFLNLALEEPHTSSGELLSNTTLVITKWAPLLKRFLKSEDDEVEVLLKFEEVCVEASKEFARLFVLILQLLYDKDLISEDAILSWAFEKKGADESDKVFVKQCEKFIQWLQEASEEEDQEEET